MRLKSILMGAAALAVCATAAQAERGSDGQVNLLYWQAVSILNPFLSGGTKDVEGSSLVLEPLARYSEAGELVPWLVDEIPTLENGGISENLLSITWVLSEGLVWSDGTPVTAADAVFTWEYCTHPEGGCAQISNFSDVTSVEAVDDRTIVITFGVPKPYPYGPLVGSQSPLIQKAQFENCLGARAPECTTQNFNPIGTGPFVVQDFRANDVVVFGANPNYRDPEKPAFSTLVLKGGGDAASAARSVLETGEFDYAWNTLVEPEILTQMLAAGRGEVVSAFGSLVERIYANQTDPRPVLGAERSTAAHPHQSLTELPVMQALSKAIDREILVITGYGEAGRITCNIVPAPEYNASTNNDDCMVQDIEGAKALLDEAGWVPGPGGVREKDGVRLSLLFQTSTNSVRQAAQALIKQWWEEVGFEVELRNIDAGVFFGGDPGSPDTFQKFYADVQMYANNFDGTDPEKYLQEWRCVEIPGPDTQWQGNNIARFCDPEYDEAVAKLGETAGLEARAELAIELNDRIIQSGTFIPLVHRGRNSVKSNTLGGVVLNAWDSELWNAADWYRAE